MWGAQLPPYCHCIDLIIPAEVFVNNIIHLRLVESYIIYDPGLQLVIIVLALISVILGNSLINDGIELDVFNDDGNNRSNASTRDWILIYIYDYNL